MADHELDLSRAVELLDRITRYAREDRAHTPGTTRLARVLTETEAFLSRIRAEATATLCYEGDCAKMTGRARPCPVHDAQHPLPTRVEESAKNRDEQLRLFGALEAVARVNELEGQLASARALLDHAETVIECAEPHVQGVSVAGDIDDWKQCYGTWLSSATSPAPERSDKRSRWNELGELPVTVMATSEYPSPAPCSGCAAAREMLAATADGLEPTAPKSAAYIRSWLKEHSNG